MAQHLIVIRKKIVYLRPMMQVSKIACGEEELSAVKRQAVEELKERMWKEVWKENIDLPQAKVEVVSLGEGIYQVTAKI